MNAPHRALLIEVAFAAATLFAVGPVPDAITVSSAELAVVTPEALSVALMVAVAPTAALAATVTRPVVLTLATFKLDDLNVSLAAVKD
jgi:hypothetical protein